MKFKEFLKESENKWNQGRCVRSLPPGPAPNVASKEEMRLLVVLLVGL